MHFIMSVIWRDIGGSRRDPKCTRTHHRVGARTVVHSPALGRALGVAIDAAQAALGGLEVLGRSLGGGGGHGNADRGEEDEDREAHIDDF